MSEHRRKPPQPQGGGRAAARRSRPAVLRRRRAAPSRGSNYRVTLRFLWRGRVRYGGRAEARRAAQRGGGRRARRGRGGAGDGGGGGAGAAAPRRARTVPAGGRGRGSQPPAKKRFIDYPRAGKYGLAALDAVLEAGHRSVHRLPRHASWASPASAYAMVGMPERERMPPRRRTTSTTGPTARRWSPPAVRPTGRSSTTTQIPAGHAVRRDLGGEQVVRDRQRHRPHGYRPRPVQHGQGRRDPGWLDHHPAVREEPRCSTSRRRSAASSRSCSSRIKVGATDGQEGHHGRLPEHLVLRTRRLRDPGGGPHVLRQGRREAEPEPVRLPGRAAQGRRRTTTRRARPSIDPTATPERTTRSGRRSAGSGSSTKRSRTAS